MPENIINWREEEENEELIERIASRRRSGLKRFIPVGWTWHHLSIFLLTFGSYALFHASRKNFSTIKTTIRDQWLPSDPPNISLASGGVANNKYWLNEHWSCRLPSKGPRRRDKIFANGSQDCFMTSEKDALEFQGTLDACFLVAYALGLYISGVIGDRYDPTKILSIGMWISAALVIIFGYVTEVAHFYSNTFYVVIWLFSGFVQACGWPTEVAVMGSWFGRSTRGCVFGLWAACASVGNIIGTELAAYFLHFGYEYTFLVNGSMLFAGGFVVYFGLVSSPGKIGLPDPEDLEFDSKVESEMDKDGRGQRQQRIISDHPPSVQQQAGEGGRGQAISFWNAVMLPGVIPYSLAYACLKMVNYSLFFWLPTFIHLKFGWGEATSDRLSTWYDWGGIVSGFVAGIITDYLPFRTPVVMGLLLTSIFSLYGYTNSPRDETINGLLLGICGVFIGGPANLITAISADLGKQPAIRGNNEALATVTGIIDGTGSIGAAAGQLIVPFIVNLFPLRYVIFFFIIMIIATNLCLLPLLIREIKEWLAKRGEVPYSRVAREADFNQSIGDGEGIFGQGSQISDVPDDNEDSILN